MRLETQKQTLQARDESIKKLLEMLQNKGMGEACLSNFFFPYTNVAILLTNVHVRTTITFDSRNESRAEVTVNKTESLCYLKTSWCRLVRRRRKHFCQIQDDFTRIFNPDCITSDRSSHSTITYNRLEGFGDR